MPTPPMMLWGVVLPILVSAVIWGLWWALERRSPGGRLGWGVSGLVVAGGFLLAFFAADPFAAFPPLMAVDWLFYSAVGLLGVTVAEGLIRPGRHWQRVLVWLPAALVMVIPVTTAWRNGLDAEFNPRSPVVAWLAVAAWTVGLLLVRAAAGRLGCAAPVWAVWLLGLTSAVSAVTLGLSGSQFAMPFRAASTGLALLPLLGLMLLHRVLRWPDLPVPAPALTGWAMLFGGVLLAGYLWYTLTWVNAVLLAGGPVLAGLVPFRRGWARLLIGLIPVLTALGLAVTAFMRAQVFDPYGY